MPHSNSGAEATSESQESIVTAAESAANHDKNKHKSSDNVSAASKKKIAHRPVWALFLYASASGGGTCGVRTCLDGVPGWWE
jgi:hypothetical protein